jgi:hypothetical protein
MSWGFLVDLHLKLSRDAWTRLQKRTPGETSLADGWSGLEDAGLERSFGRPWSQDATYRELLPRYADAESIVQIDASGDPVAIRVCVIVDKSTLENAYPLAALLHAAAAEAGEGTLRLVNDGTYSGESGSVIALARGSVTAAAIADDAVLEELSAELLERIEQAAAAGERPKPGRNPFTGQPVGGDE